MLLSIQERQVLTEDRETCIWTQSPRQARTGTLIPRKEIWSLLGIPNLINKKNFKMNSTEAWDFFLQFKRKKKKNKQTVCKPQQLLREECKREGKEPAICMESATQHQAAMLGEGFRERLRKPRVSEKAYLGSGLHLKHRDRKT